MYSRPAEPKPPKKTATGGQVRGRTDARHLPTSANCPRPARAGGGTQAGGGTKAGGGRPELDLAAGGTSR